MTRLSHPTRKSYTYPITFLSNSSQALLKERVCEGMGLEAQARTLTQVGLLLSITPNHHPIPGGRHSLPCSL